MQPAGPAASWHSSHSFSTTCPPALNHSARPTRRRLVSSPVCQAVQVPQAPGSAYQVAISPAITDLTTPQPLLALSPGQHVQLQLRRPTINQETAGRVNALIQQCKDWDQLVSLYEQQKDRLSLQNQLVLIRALATAKRVKKLTRFEDSAAQALVSSVVETLLKGAEQLRYQDVADCMWALGKLGMHPGRAHVNKLLQIAQASFSTRPKVGAPQMATLIWGIARLGHVPTQEWLSSFLAVTTTCIPEMPPRSLANTIWALEALKVPPQALQDFLPAFLHASGSWLMRSPPQTVSNISWALSRIGCQPDEHWLHAFWTSSAHLASQRQLNPVDLGQVLSAAACFHQHSPAPDSWLPQVLEGTAGCSVPVDPKALVMCLMSLVRLRAEPVDWIKKLLDRGHASLKDMGAQEASNLVWALAHCRHTPVRKSFARCWFKASFNTLSYLNAQDCATMVWSISVLGWRPPPECVWLAAMQEESFKRLPYFNSQQCTAVIKGWYRMAWPPKLWMERFYIDTVHLLPTFSSKDLCTLLVALATCPVRPPQQWLAQWLLTTQPRLMSFTGQEIIMALSSLYALGRQVDDTWLSMLQHVVAQAARATHADMRPSSLREASTSVGGVVRAVTRGAGSGSGSDDQGIDLEGQGEGLPVPVSRRSSVDSDDEVYPGLAVASRRRRQVRALKHAAQQGAVHSAEEVSADTAVRLSRNHVYTLVLLLPSFQVAVPTELLALADALGYGLVVEKGQQMAAGEVGSREVQALLRGSGVPVLAGITGVA